MLFTHSNIAVLGSKCYYSLPTMATIPDADGERLSYQATTDHRVRYESLLSLLSGHGSIVRRLMTEVTVAPRDQSLRWETQRDLVEIVFPPQPVEPVSDIVYTIGNKTEENVRRTNRQWLCDKGSVVGRLMLQYEADKRTPLLTLHDTHDTLSRLPHEVWSGIRELTDDAQASK